MNAGYQFAKTLAGEFFGNFNSARHEAQEVIHLSPIIVLHFESKFGKRKGALLSPQQIRFNEYVNQKTLGIWAWVYGQPVFERIPIRSLGINFTWKFGKLEFKKPKEENPINLNAPSAE